MHRYLDRRTFASRLIVSTVILILITTLSAGLPAYWLTQRELTRQAWRHVADARQATASLVQAEQEQLRGLAVLLSERPTLHRLLREEQTTELEAYLRAFQQRRDSDVLLICDGNGLPVGQSAQLVDCTTTGEQSVQRFSDQAALVTVHAIVDSTDGLPLGRVILARRLNESFLRQLAANTGIEQSILQPDGSRLSSSFIAPTTTVMTEPMDEPEAIDTPTILTVADKPYFATAFALTAADAASPLYLEVALPADQLQATQWRALGILATSTGAIALLGLIMGVGYVRRLVRPLRHLTQTAHRIGSGELTTPVPTFQEPAEVATLAAALQRSQGRMLQALNELAAARDWLDHLIQAVAEGVVTVDATGQVTFLNQKAAGFTPFAMTDAVGHHINDLFPVAEEGSAAFWELLPKPGGKIQITVAGERSRHSIDANQRLAMRFGQPSPRRLGNSGKGRKLVLEVTVIGLADEQGDGAQTALVLRDISEEQLLRNLRSYFLANITHEFRTPLSTFNASLELLLDEQENLTATEMRTLLKPVHLSLLALQTLIDNLLESSSIEAGRFVLRRRPVEVGQVIADAVQMVQPLFERRQQLLHVIEPPLLPELNADGPRLTQVLINLLTNAGKYSPIGETIELTIEQTPTVLRMTVADCGPGVPAAEMAQLFQNFVRANNHAEDQYGVGLGLYVVKTTIEAHGGQVGVRAREGGGSCFWVELPLTKGEGSA